MTPEKSLPYNGLDDYTGKGTSKLVVSYLSDYVSILANITNEYQLEKSE